MNKKLQTILRNTIIGALYIALTLLFGAISYGQVQFRISEILIVFVLFNSNYIYGLTLGCLISNIFSPMALYDVFFGTLATLASLVIMSKVKNPFISLIAPVILNALIVGLELQIALGLDFFISALYVGAGELLVLYVLGIPLYYAIRENSKILDIIDAKIEIFDRPSPFYKLDGFFKASLVTLIMLFMPLKGEELNLINKDYFVIFTITIPMLYAIMVVLSFIKLDNKIYRPILILLELAELICYSIIPIFNASIEYTITYILLISLFTLFVIGEITYSLLLIKKEHKEKLKA